jgi:hypothetical protein
MTEGRKDDTGKRRWQLLRKGCVHALEAVIKVLEYGAKKYGDENWKLVENAEVRYRDALDRHLADLDKGIVYDPDTEEHQYAHVATNALFLLELHEAKKAGLVPRTEVPEAPPLWRNNPGSDQGLPEFVDVQLRSGAVMTRVPASFLRWSVRGDAGDIIYWRHSA